MPETRKRKKTADMPDSPPKTRARAKASHDENTKLKTVKVVAPSAKAAAEEQKKPPLMAQGSKRRTRADGEHGAIEETDHAKAIQTRGRTKKAEGTDEEAVATTEAPKKSRGRQIKPQATDEQDEKPAPISRAKSKKDEDLRVKGESNVVVQEKANISKPTVRTRAAAARTNAASNSRPPRPSALEKKVKFQSDAEKDKENVPVEIEHVAPKATGLRAKPIRKPASMKTATRGRKTASRVAETKTRLSGDLVNPLSPKKIKQVAKSSSIGSEDELCGVKTPPRALSRSPIKPLTSSSHEREGAPLDVGFNTTTVPSSPTKSISSTVFQSPARRPPLSPFKDALRQSPKKCNLGDSTARPYLVATQSPSKCTMKDSPKRGLPSLPPKPIMFSQTPFKASLLQSPARRPGGSPVRSVAIKSSRKDGNVEGPEQNPTPLAPRQELCSSPSRVARTPTHPPKLNELNKPSRMSSEQLIESASPDPINHEAAVPYVPVDSTANLSPSAFFESVEKLSVADQQVIEPCETDLVSEDILMVPNQINEVHSESASGDLPGSHRFEAPAFSLASHELKDPMWESDSEDELASQYGVDLNTPVSKHGVSARDFAIQSGNSARHSWKRDVLTRKAKRASIAMTPLAAQMSAWLASSPEKKTPAATLQPGPFLFSPTEAISQASPPKASFFDDEMALLDSNDDLPDAQKSDDEQNLLLLRTSHESQASEEYGDENEMPPIEPQLILAEDVSQVPTMTCTPAKVFYMQPREIHTVSKVPLRPAADESPSPLKVPRKRSRSLTGISKPMARSPLVGQGQSLQGVSSNHGECSTPLVRRSNNDDSLIIDTPRTLRKSNVSSALKGAVVFVDVHTTEGEDASGIFFELLTQMGARCVKQWSWNPRTSMASAAWSPENSTDGSEESEPLSSKVGITHVVYKDGGKRTMEKVRASKGIVHCVGVGWVLDCEREDRWLEEADYAIDVSIIPRGGHRRRKSMEPRMLANLNGNLIPAQTPTKPAFEMSPTKEFLTFDTPASRRESFEIQKVVPATPIVPSNGDGFSDSPLSPTTPYYLSKGAQLVQHTCPPKQTQELLFPVSGRIDDQPDEAVRQRLLVARRKSLQWVPKISSPLGRAVSYGK